MLRMRSGIWIRWSSKAVGMGRGLKSPCPITLLNPHIHPYHSHTGWVPIHPVIRYSIESVGPLVPVGLLFNFFFLFKPKNPWVTESQGR